MDVTFDFWLLSTSILWLTCNIGTRIVTAKRCSYKILFLNNKKNNRKHLTDVITERYQLLANNNFHDRNQIQNENIAEVSVRSTNKSSKGSINIGRVTIGRGRCWGSLGQIVNSAPAV